MIVFENSFAALPEAFYRKVQPEKVSQPQLIAWNDDLAKELLLEFARGEQQDQQLAQIFSGNAIPATSIPLACAYAGHQFGHFVPALGDGRALLLGELRQRNGRLYDVQLKGSGRTPFSRAGDGKSALGPVLREYILSESMHRLGVPTTRALAAVASGDTVYRERPTPGGIFTRVSESLIRVGTFEYFACRGDWDNVQRLLAYVVQRSYPELAESENVPRAFFQAAATRQAALIAQWLSYGFIHGVMNTDNASVAGLTIDYGPCAFLDETKRDKVFSSIDTQGRYAYGNQPAIAQWNLARLAETLIPLFPVAEAEAIEALKQELLRFPPQYEKYYHAAMLKKLGLQNVDDESIALLEHWLTLLETEGLDFTLSFRRLPELVDHAGPHEFFGPPERWQDFRAAWQQKLERQGTDWRQIHADMDKVNPLFIPRNHQVERAIKGALQGDYGVFHDLVHVMQKPFELQPAYLQYAEAPTAAQKVCATFCGT